MEQVQDILIGREAEIKHLDAIVSSKFLLSQMQGWRKVRS